MLLCDFEARLEGMQAGKKLCNGDREYNLQSLINEG